VLIALLQWKLEGKSKCVHFKGGLHQHLNDVSHEDLGLEFCDCIRRKQNGEKGKNRYVHFKGGLHQHLNDVSEDLRLEICE
jgi:hypothetical protein